MGNWSGSRSVLEANLEPHQIQTQQAQPKQTQKRRRFKLLEALGYLRSSLGCGGGT
jgi:hypothetical protein